MKKLSGLVLDRHDDVDDSVFRTIFPDSTPELVKSAHPLSSSELGRMPNDTFALILHDGDHTLRKFSMADAGNTALSVEYFFKTGHKLPAEAQKVAAANLVAACGWYDIEPPDALQKIALGVGTLLGLATVPGAAREAKNNLNVVKGAPGIMTPQQIKAQRLQMGV